MLAFLAPVDIFLMWKNNKFKNTLRIALSIALDFWFLIVGAMSSAEEVADLCIKYGWDISNIKPHSHFAKKDCPHRTDMRCFLHALQYHLDQYYKQNTPQNFAIDTVIIVNNPTDELAAKYLNRVFGWGVLMPHQYEEGTARRVVVIGG